MNWTSAIRTTFATGKPLWWAVSLRALSKAGLIRTSSLTDRVSNRSLMYVRYQIVRTLHWTMIDSGNETESHICRLYLESSQTYQEHTQSWGFSQKRSNCVLGRRNACYRRLSHSHITWWHTIYKDKPLSLVHRERSGVLCRGSSCGKRRNRVCAQTGREI